MAIWSDQASASRPRRFEVGDRVSCFGFIDRKENIRGSSTSFRYRVNWDGPAEATWVDPWELDSLTLVMPPEPPVGSVVVKDGIPYLRTTQNSYPWADPTGWHRPWGEIAAGQVVFTPDGGE